jgi:hypothetical protein
MKVDHDKTTATTEVVSSHPGETRQWSQKWRRNTARAGKKPERTEKMTCKPMEQDENDQYYKKSPRRSWVTNQMGNPDLNEGSNACLDFFGRLKMVRNGCYKFKTSHLCGIFIVVPFFGFD